MLTNLLFDRIFSETDSAKVCFINKRCLRSRFNKSECRACLDECQTEALKLDGRSVVFKQEKCTGCMRCVSACPNDAFNSGLDLKRLLEGLSSSSQVVLTCRKNAPFQQKLYIPCIGSLSESLLAAMNSVATNSFSIDLSHCSECINRHCLNSFNLKVGKLTDKLKVSKHIPLRYNFEKNSPLPVTENISRRFYLGMAKKSLLDLGKRSMGAGKAETSASLNHTRKGPATDAMALQYAWKHSSSKEYKDVLLSFFYTANVITEKCNLCPGCQGMCPTGALKRTDLKGVKQLMFTSSACNGCNLCQEFCKKNAIQIIRGFTGNPEKPKCLC